jgi:lipopolysaccharide transport system permease protein
MTQSKRPKQQTVVIQPRQNVALFGFAEYLNYRSMIKRMVLREIKSKFEDMKLSILWNLVRPLSVTAVFALFKHASGATTGEVMPYPLFIYSGLIIWYYFTDAAQETASSLRKDAGIIKKVYFPRLIVPIVPVISNLILLGVSFIPLFIMMLFYSSHVGLTFLLLPLVVVQCGLFSLGLGILFASLSLKSRDFEQLLTFMLYIGLFISCVYFSPALFKGPIAMLIHLNPMAATLQSFRACLESTIAFPWGWWLYAVLASIVIFIAGIQVFNSVEKELVDRL